MKMPSTQYDTFQMAGGLDQLTPTLSLKSGAARRAVNFECSITGGYTRIGGYERFDGRARPSQAFYVILNCTLGGSIAVGDTVTGATSGATAKVIGLVGGAVAVTRQVGVMVTGENLTVLGTVRAVLNSISGAVADGLLDATYLSLAAGEYRTSIAAVPGSGAVLGGFAFKGLNYAWRNNAGATAAILHVQSSTGWTAVAFRELLSFTNANTGVGEGDTIAQGAVTATVARVILRSGTLGSGVNTGVLVLTGRAGGNFAAGAATTTGAGALTLSGAQAAPVQAPGGKYRHSIGNFGASSANQGVYGCDGINNGFEFDGTALIPISTGMVVDTPSFVAVHKQHLFFAFDFSLQFSGIGDPFSWTAVVGAGEIGLPDTLTNLMVLPGNDSTGAMLVTSKNDMVVLYGTSGADFTLTTFNSGVGARADSTQNLEQAYLLTDFGVTSLTAAKEFGNFNPATLTQNLRTYVSERTPLISASGVQRSKGQYRLFFSDGSGLYTTVREGQSMGSMPVEFPNPVVTTWEGLDVNGNATSFFGSSNGMVYELDAGTSFDGAEINASFQLVFNSTQSHRLLKRYRKASLELAGSSYIALDVGYDLGYKSLDIAQSSAQSYAQFLRTDYWDSFTWDSFVWDGSEIIPAEIYLDGTAENISFRIASLSALVAPFTINTITTHYTPRRGLR
jgi:hypothetical protein